MSIFKPFTTSDVVVSPFKVNKTFTFTGTAALTGSGIDLFIGENINPNIWVSGSNPTGYNSTQDKFLLYRSIRELYYYNYLFGDDGSPVTTASFNPDGTITTDTQYTPNAYNYLCNTLPASRYFPTGSGEVIGIISIPSNLFGEYIKPGTFYLAVSGSNDPSFNDYVDDDYIDNYFTGLATSTVVLQDDGEGNIICNDEKVGDIIYEHGIIILTSDGIPGQDGYGYVNYGTTTYGLGDSLFIEDIINSPNLVCSFNSTLTMYETQYKCTIRENEYNFSQNPTLISGSSDNGSLYNFATGSSFTPYVTTVGLYDNNYNLLAIAKLSQPLPLSSVTDTSILINLDL
jgi:hypothetical protein